MGEGGEREVDHKATLGFEATSEEQGQWWGRILIGLSKLLKH